MIPSTGEKQDFRDPKILKSGDTWYSLIANKNIDGSGQILVYKSENLEDWSYHGVLCQSNNEIGRMWECPDLFSIEGHDVFTISAMHLPHRGEEFTNIYSSLYAVGRLGIHKPEFYFDEYHEIDYGLDFYAPQTVETPDGRIIMIGWMQMWERNYPTDDMKHGWACALTLPREITVKDGHLIQKPARELKAYRENHVSYTDVDVDGSVSLEGVAGNQIELDLLVDMQEADSFKVELFKSGDEHFDLEIISESSCFTFSRANIKTPISGLEDHQVDSRTFTIDTDDKIRLQIFLDVSTVEVFINDGQYVSSSTVFPSDLGTGIEISSVGAVKIETIRKWDIRLQG